MAPSSSWWIIYSLFSAMLRYLLALSFVIQFSIPFFAPEYNTYFASSVCSSVCAALAGTSASWVLPVWDAAEAAASMIRI